MVRWYVSICAWIFLPFVLFVVACNFCHTVDSPLCFVTFFWLHFFSVCGTKTFFAFARENSPVQPLAKETSWSGTAAAIARPPRSG